MKSLDLIPAATALVQARIPAFLWGAPGIGKSDIVRQVADSLSLPVIDVRAVTLDPVDVRGLPTVSDGAVKWLPMGELPNAARDGESGILFLDELNAAPGMVQAALLQLALERRIGEYRLPDGWSIIAAGNRTTDRASAQRLSSALANRFAHLDLDVDVDSWCRWAMAEGLSAELVAFIRFRPMHLHAFEPDRVVNATPRTWAFADKILKASLPKDVELATLASIVGEGPAAELFGFLKVFRSLPSPDAVLMNPDTAPVPSDGATLFAICGALARKVTDRSMTALVTYLDRLPAEYGVLCIKDATSRDSTLANTPGAISFFSNNGAVYA